MGACYGDNNNPTAATGSVLRALERGQRRTTRRSAGAPQRKTLRPDVLPDEKQPWRPVQFGQTCPLVGDGTGRNAASFKGTASALGHKQTNKEKQEGGGGGWGGGGCGVGGQKNHGGGRGGGADKKKNTQTITTQQNSQKNKPKQTRPQQSQRPPARLQAAAGGDQAVRLWGGGDPPPKWTTGIEGPVPGDSGDRSRTWPRGDDRKVI